MNTTSSPIEHVLNSAQRTIENSASPERLALALGVINLARLELAELLRLAHIAVHVEEEAFKAAEAAANACSAQLSGGDSSHLH